MTSRVNGRRAARPLPFERLQRQARRLQWLAVALLATIVVVPALVSIAFALRELDRETMRHARHLAFVVTADIRHGGLRVEHLRALLDDAIVREGTSAIDLIGQDGRRIFRIGTEGTRDLVHADVRLPDAAAPAAELRVTADSGGLVARSVRIFAVHLLVATALAAAVYRLPMRSLRHAIDEVEATHVQLLHSAKLVAIGEIYAGLAHEINNPLGIILSRVRLMLGGAAERKLTDDLVRDLTMVERHGNRIAQIVRSLLTFSRKTSFELRETDLNAVVQDAVALVEAPFAKQGIRVTTTLDPHLSAVRGSRDHLQQVVLNLLTNARDAMPDGGTIAVRTYGGPGVVVAEVEDGGTGMTPDVQARVFEPFFTTKREGRGTGLGLSVSHSIVSAHGGDIEVESEAGDGARFRFTLPAVDGRR